MGNDDDCMRKFHAAVGDDVGKEKPATGHIWNTNETGASHPVECRSVFVIRRMCRELEFED